MIVIVGSHAALHRCRLEREPVDIDIVGTYEDVESFVTQTFGRPKSFMPTQKGKGIVAKAYNGTIIEAEIAWEDSSAEQLMELVAKDPYTEYFDGFKANQNAMYDGQVAFPSLNVLYLLKMSHRFLKNSPHFQKTMDDIIMLRERGGFIEPQHFDFYKARERATYDYKHPALNVAKNDFFTGDGVKYVYDHDTIHEAVKHLEYPAYTYFKPPNSEVMCSREMFELLPFRTQLFAVLEEAYVLAAERSQLSFPDAKITPRKSFDMALEKVCTSITSGWFRDFAWDNFYNVRALYNDNYMERIYKGVEAGVVKPHSSGDTHEQAL